MLRQLLILLACPLLDDVEHATLLAMLCSTLVGESMLTGRGRIRACQSFRRCQGQVTLM